MTGAQRGRRESFQRKEDVRLLAGGGGYVSDVQLGNELHCMFLRSEVAAGRVAELRRPRPETGRAAHVYAADDLGPGIAVPLMYRFPDQVSEVVPALASEHVQYHGQPVAVVLAPSRYEAEDLAERVAVDVIPSPPLAEVPHPSQVFTRPAGLPDLDTAGTIATLGANLGAYGTAPEGFEHAIDFSLARAAACPIEPRGVVARYDAYRRRLEVVTSSQMPHAIRRWLSEIVELPEPSITVIAPDVGGGFGQKWHLYAEEIVVARLAMIHPGTAIRWTEDRREHFVASVHARTQRTHVRAAFSPESRRIEGLQVRSVVDQGAHFHTCGPGPARNLVYLAGGGYNIRPVDAAVASVRTHRTPYGAYRGFGQEGALFVVERTLDFVARQNGESRLGIRERHLPASHELPYTTATGQVMDSGSFAKCLRMAAEAIDFERAEGEFRPGHGVGIAFYVERTGVGSSEAVSRGGWDESTFDTAEVRVEPDGTLLVRTGLVQLGQGVETALATVVAEQFGVDLDDVTVDLGTTSGPHSGFGTAASRGIVAGASAVELATLRLIDGVLDAASQISGVGPSMLRVDSGHVRSADGSVALTLAEVARAYYVQRPGSFKDAALSATASFDPPGAAFAYGAHAVEASVDLDTGLVAIDRYVVAHDCGPVIHKGSVEGQIRGGIAQGIGQALFERFEYDEGGRLTNDSLTTYRLPRSSACPDIEFMHMETPSPFTVSGRKGVGEAGVLVAPAAIASAVQHAIGERSSFITTLPMTPDVVLAHLHP